MKIDGLTHPKTKELSYTLEIPLPHAIGLLELLWAFVAQQTPQGNVGKWSNAVIAGEAGWDKNPDDFVNALVSIGFLDKNPDHRLLVHDWSDHAPNWVHAKLKKNGKTIIRADLSSDLRGGQDRGSEATTSLAKPRQDKSMSDSDESNAPVSIAEKRNARFDEWWEVYGKKENRKKAESLWRNLKWAKLGIEPDDLIADTRNRLEQDPKWPQYQPHPTTYLNGERWNDAIPDAELTLPKDRDELWRIRSSIGLEYQFDDLQSCHAEIRQRLRGNAELRRVAGL